MNIVYFIDHLRWDGTQTALSQLVHGLAARGHQQTVVCLNDSWDEELLKRLRQTGAEVRIVGKLPILMGYGIISVLRWLRKANVDVAVTLLFVSDVIGRTVARLAGVRRIVSSIRTRNVDYSRLNLRLVRATMPAADAVIINSANVREFAISHEGARPERIHIIPNGIDPARYDGPSQRLTILESAGIDNAESKALIGSVGRLTRQKGFDVLLKAFAQLKWPECELLIAGVGEEATALRELSTKLAVQDRVHFVGYRRDVPAFLKALDLYVHPARFEGMPNALLEAMAAGCPIVATSVDGSTELIEDGVHGWLVPPEDPGALAKAIDTALRDQNEARRRGLAARQKAACRFSIETMITAWEAILKQNGNIA